MDFADLVDNIPVVSVFHGEGAYEGLIAIVEFELAGQGWDLKGVIIDGGLPSDPSQNLSNSPRTPAIVEWIPWSSH